MAHARKSSDYLITKKLSSILSNQNKMSSPLETIYSDNSGGRAILKNEKNNDFLLLQEFMAYTHHS